MAKIKLTKNELKAQRDALKDFKDISLLFSSKNNSYKWK